MFENGWILKEVEGPNEDLSINHGMHIRIYLKMYKKAIYIYLLIYIYIYLCSNIYIYLSLKYISQIYIYIICSNKNKYINAFKNIYIFARINK